MAHGAVFRLSRDVRITYGHLIAKSIQLVVEAGRSYLDNHEKVAKSQLSSESE